MADHVDTADIGFTKMLPATALGEGSGPPADVGVFCTCFTSENPGRVCALATAVPDADCTRTYAKDCKKLLACAAGDPAAAPVCGAGQGNVGAARRCRALCSNDVPCAKGRCTEWQGGRACM